VILADTSVWADHLRRPDPKMRVALGAGKILVHPLVIGELACGHLRTRDTLVQMQLLAQANIATHDEVLNLIEQHKLMGRGVGYVDFSLLASARLSKAKLWTRDKRLSRAAEEFAIRYDESLIIDSPHP
jgi:predicted nucleic acid-binding protein